MRQAKNRELTVLFVTHAFGAPAKAGNERRILRLAQWLKSQGCHVHIAWKAHPNEVKCAQAELDGIGVYPLWQYKPNRPMELSSSKPLNRYEEAICPDWLSEQVETLDVLLQPDMIISEYIFMSRCLEGSKTSLKIIDTHDVFSRRKKMVENFGIKESYFVPADEEAKMLSRADLLMAIQNQEATFLKELASQASVVTCGVDFDDVLKSRIRKSRKQYSAIIVASDNPANRAGMGAFLRECWPLIRKAKRNASLLIVGGVSKSFKRVPPGVKLCGPVDDLSVQYGKCEIALNPVAAGTGLKVKTVEALAYGKPVVSLPNGLEGIRSDASDRAYFCANDWADFAERTLKLLQDPKTLLDSQHAAKRFAKKEFSSETCYKELGQYLDRWFSNRTNNKETS